MADDDLARVFKALAGSARREVLDRLHERNGQTLGELCARLSMTRQAASEHLAVLEAANLISTTWRGREKVHYLNPVPLQEIQERWIDKFERPRLRALGAIRRAAEEHDMPDRPTYLYVTYVKATPEQVWHALTDADVTAAYWGHSNVSDWRPGSRWEHVRTDGSGIADVVGTVVEAVPPRRLVLTFADPGGPADGTGSQVTFEVERHHDIVRLTVRHEDLTGPDEYAGAAAGWPAVMANLKSLLETGSVLPQAPWEMHADLRAASMARNDAR